MNKLNIGQDLASFIDRGISSEEISRWALKVYSENIRELDSSLIETLEIIFSMNDDPQFKLGRNQLQQVAEKLIEEGKEEFAESDSQIEEIAELLSDNWLMCPLCDKTWETFSRYGVIKCPGCKKDLLNPKKI